MMGNYHFYYANDISALTGGQYVTFVNTAQADSVQVEREWQLRSANALVTFPAGLVITKKEGGSFAFYQLVNQDFSINDVTTDGLDTADTNNIAGKIKIGIPGLNLSFDKTVTLSFNVGSQYESQTLEIDTLEEGGSAWANETSCLVTNGSCSFTVDHASYFAAISTAADGTSTGVATGSFNGNITINSNTPLLRYSTSKKAVRKITLTFNGLVIKKKSWAKIRLNGRKVTISRLKQRGSDTVVTLSVKYKKWPKANYNLQMSYRNKIKTGSRWVWERGNVTAESILSIL
jgi:hypothetical protein